MIPWLQTAIYYTGLDDENESHTVQCTQNTCMYMYVCMSTNNTTSSRESRKKIMWYSGFHVWRYSSGVDCKYCIQVVFTVHCICVHVYTMYVISTQCSQLYTYSITAEDIHVHVLCTCYNDSVCVYLSFWMQLDVSEVKAAEMTGELYVSCCEDLTLSVLVVGTEHYWHWRIQQIPTPDYILYPYWSMVITVLHFRWVQQSYTHIYM